MQDTSDVLTHEFSYTLCRSGAYLHLSAEKLRFRETWLSSLRGLMDIDNSTALVYSAQPVHHALCLHLTSGCPSQSTADTAHFTPCSSCTCHISHFPETHCLYLVFFEHCTEIHAHQDRQTIEKTDCHNSSTDTLHTYTCLHSQCI